MSYVIGYLNGAFEASELSIRLRDIAKEYHTKCDAFDAKTCSGLCEKTGDPMPINQWELQRINCYAYEVKQSLYSRNKGISPSQIRKAIRDYRPD